LFRLIKYARFPVRFLIAMAFASLLGAAVPAVADTITYDVPFSLNTYPASDTVYGPQFNPVLGTLTEVSAIVTGTYLPDIVGPTLPSTTTAAFYEYWGGDCSCGSGNMLVGTYTLTNGKGPAQAFSFSTGALPNLQNYIQFFGVTTGFLLNVGAFSESLTPGAWGNDWNDQSTYSGTVDITYTYTVPEPSSLAILAVGAGLLGLGGFARRRVSVAGASA